MEDHQPTILRRHVQMTNLRGTVLPTISYRTMSIGSGKMSSKVPRVELEPIVFTEDNASGVTFPHHDPLVTAVEIAHCEVAWVFVDRGSLVNIIFLSTFRQMGIRNELLDRHCPTFIAFNEGHIQPLGHMLLTLSIGTHPRRANITTDFTVAKYLSSYNVILGHLAIIDLNLSINMRALLIKFPPPKGSAM